MSTFVVSTLADSGAGSLRAAIEAANAASTPSTIQFEVGGTITLASDLPSITQTVTLDATTAPGHVAAGAPAVELNCNGNAGLTFATGADGSQLLGMAIGNSSGNGVTLDASRITLAGNYIGLGLNGTALSNSGDGIYVAATSSGNVIGSNPSAASGVVSNVISNNVGNGISFHGSAHNTLVDNYIGTDPTGTVAMANGGNGIWLTDGSNANEIGGTAYTDTATGAVNDPTGDKGSTTPVFVVPPLGNLVSGNGANGILIDSGSQNNVLNGNFVGTTADGNSALGNAQDGVAINGANNNFLVGCDFSQNPFVYYNVLSGNGGNGLHITDSNNITVQANFFGIGANNATLVGNALNGILVDGSSQNVQVGGVIPLGNVAAGNGQNGIEVAGTVSGFTTFNTFGGLFAFGGAAPNGNDGLLITATGGNQDVQTNVFSGNTNDGIEIGGAASGVTVDPNMVGVNTVGSAELANGNDGIEIDGTAHDNVIGGYQLSVIPQNTFSGNDGYGVAIDGQAYDNQVFNAYVGLDALGTASIPNGAGGILIGDTATGNTIGGAAATTTYPVADVVSGNQGNGITLADGSSDTTVTNNVIGFGAHLNQLILNTGTPIATGASTGNIIADNYIACFAAGTRIATPGGEIPVEALAAGDRVRLAREPDGDGAAIVWIGHRRIDCSRHPAPQDVWPVRISRGAFAPGVPHRPLFLSPDHAVLCAGGLVPVRYLVNGRTIVQVPRRAVQYFHVELAAHDVLLAEGLACETYLDTGNRADFENGGTVVRMHPALALRVWDTRACAPLVLEGPALLAARRRLLDRAAALGHATTRDPAVRLRVEGRVLQPEMHGRMHRFRVPAHVRRVELLSRSGVPAETRADTDDHRRLGIAVATVRLGGSAIPLADARLGRGWHAPERGADSVVWRWTDGAAEIALAGGGLLDIVVAMTECYWADPPDAGVLWR